jgi:hypothetical protein
MFSHWSICLSAVHLTRLSGAQTYVASNEKGMAVNPELKMMWKGTVWPNVRYYHDIFLEIQRLPERMPGFRGSHCTDRTEHVVKAALC